MFNYGSFKLFLLKIFLGILFFSFSLFLFVSIFSYSPSDPGIGRLVGKSEITNFFGFWGAVFSSIFLTLFGKASFFLVIFITYLSAFMSLGLVFKKPLLKILFILLSVTLINISILLQKGFETDTGLLSKILFDIYRSYFPFLINDLLYRSLSVVCFTLISIILFLYCFSINISFFINIIFQFIYIFICQYFQLQSKRSRNRQIGRKVRNC